MNPIRQRKTSTWKTITVLSDTNQNGIVDEVFDLDSLGRLIKHFPIKRNRKLKTEYSLLISKNKENQKTFQELNAEIDGYSFSNDTNFTQMTDQTEIQPNSQYLQFENQPALFDTNEIENQMHEPFDYNFGVSILEEYTTPNEYSFLNKENDNAMSDIAFMIE